MEHLKTSKERKERWYSTQKPRFVEVKDISDTKEPYPEGIDSHIYGIPCSFLNKDQDRRTLCDALETNGFAVITGVVSEFDCVRSLGMAWDYIEAASFAEACCRQNSPTSAPVSRHNVESHSSNFFPHSLEGGFLPFYGSGYSYFAWDIRGHQNVRKVFECLHGTSNLISSMDGVVLWHEKQPRTDAGWFHLDQNPVSKPGKCGIQGLVNLLPVSEASGGNVMVAKSHKKFPHHYCSDRRSNDSEKHFCSDFYEQRLKELGSEDWMEIDPNDEIILQNEAIVTCLLKPGDMIIWDSRTVHCSNRGYGDINRSGTNQNRLEEAAHGLIRAATAVSMMPTDSVSSTILNRRVSAAKESRTMTHWTNQVTPLGQENLEGSRLEERRIKFMKNYERLTGKKALVNFDHLSRQELRLVQGQDANKDDDPQLLADS
ncbi:unnamed protein product [Cylindrotheca closterium]|uniref:Uncharacterized protein n=1 Tax=Cylindrotheca closterium TaxID=2856 RepID=A0AAD2CQX4_9STRA|nr:unnamed protein product [Cylindrotheca closterium]